VARYTYDPFGNVLSKAGPLADANLYRFSSKESHQPSGLVYYLYRFYDPNLQRWVSRDPIGVEGGINLYGFVGNNPVTHLEPFGLMWPWPQVPTWMSPDGVPHYGTPPSEQPTEKRCSWGAMSGWDNNINGKGAEDLVREVGSAVPKGVLAACMMFCDVGEAAGAGELRSAASAAANANKIKKMADCVKAAKTIGQAGRNTGVRVVKSVDELNHAFANLSRGGKVVNAPGYKGKWWSLPTGRELGYAVARRQVGRRLTYSVGGSQ
jgi:RHS repeat-associated protein